MAESFSRAFLPSGVSPGALTEVLGPDHQMFFTVGYHSGNRGYRLYRAGAVTVPRGRYP
jgi:hypothetical protein